MISLFKKPSTNKNEVVEQEEKHWLPETAFEEGQLALDVYETDKHIIIKSTIAGARPEDLDITLDNDMLTIRGQRHDETEEADRDYLYKECYWGSFSRSVILPVEVDNRHIDAVLENGVLTVTLKKIKKASRVGVKVKN